MSKSQLAKAALKTAACIASSRHNDDYKNDSFDRLLKGIRVLGIVAFSLSVTSCDRPQPENVRAANAQMIAERQAIAPTTTDRYTIINGQPYKVGKRGGCYQLVITSKNGKQHKKYLKTAK